MGLTALLLASTLAAASPEVRQAMDALTWLQGPAAADKPARLTLVHFWTTWCTPCVVNLPEYNRMVDALAPDGSVRFLTVSIESPAPVQKFLGKRRIAGELALDPQSALFKALHADGFPTSVLLDAQGAVLAQVHSALLGEGVVRAALQGRPITFPARTPRTTPPRDPVCGTDPATVQVSLQEVRVDPEKPWRSMGSGRADGFEGMALSLEMLIVAAYGAPPARIDWEVVPDDVFYDVCIRSEVEGFDWKATLRDLLRATYGVEAVSRVAPGVTYRLLAPAPKLPPPSEEGSVQWSPGSLQGGHLDGANLAQLLELGLKRTVRDETKLEAPFSLELTWDVGDPNGLRDALRKVGLDLVSETETEERWVVRRAVP